MAGCAIVACWLPCLSTTQQGASFAALPHAKKENPQPNSHDAEFTSLLIIHSTSWLAVQGQNLLLSSLKVAGPVVPVK